MGGSGFLLTGNLGSDLDFEVHGELSLQDLEQFEASTLAFGAYRLQLDKWTIELTPARHEQYLEGEYGHSNFKAIFLSDEDFTQSFKRRDFTINAIGHHWRKQEWIDPFDGRLDLSKHLLRPCSEDFIRDPVRYLRAIRFSCDFSLSPELQQLLPQMSLQHLTAHYFFSELFKSSNHHYFLSSCLGNPSLPKEFQDICQVLMKGEQEQFCSEDHLSYEYFQQGGKSQSLGKQWQRELYCKLCEVNFTQWQQLLDLDYKQFLLQTQARSYLALFHSYGRHHPQTSFMHPEHSAIFEHFDLMLKAPSPQVDQIDEPERGFYRIYHLAKSTQE